MARNPAPTPLASIETRARGGKLQARCKAHDGWVDLDRDHFYVRARDNTWYPRCTDCVKGGIRKPVAEATAVAKAARKPRVSS